VAQNIEQSIARAIQGDERAALWCMQQVVRGNHTREITSALLAAAQESWRRFEKLREEMKKRIVPAMVRGTWQDDGATLIDIEIGGRRAYCSPGSDGSADPSTLGVGDEIAVATIEGGPTVLVRPLDRPFETTGRYGMVVDIRRREDGIQELEIESGQETCSCIASGGVVEAIDEGEIDALGGFPITAIYEHGIVWRLLQRKGRAEQNTQEVDEVTLAEFAGYGAIRDRVTRSIAIQVLSLEPAVLTDGVGVPSGLTNPPFQGIFATGAPGTGKTYLSLAVIGSLRAEIGVPKTRAKLAALRLWAATHPQDRLYELAGSPGVGEAFEELQQALDEQYRGIRSFGIEVATPDLTRLGDAAPLAERLLEGYRVSASTAATKLRDLEKLAEANRSDFMVLTMNKEDYIRPWVGEGLNALSAQIKRAQNHDDLVILLLSEAEVLLSSRGHQARYYTDEIVSKLLETFSGPVPCRNLFVLADGNRPDMVDYGFAGRRLESVHFEGLGHEDREPVIRAILERNGAEEGRVGALAQHFLDLIYARTAPLCELVMVDESKIPLTVDHVLTPAMIQNIVRTANSEALARGALELDEKDLEVAWTRELSGQARRFSEEEIVRILNLDRRQAGRVIEVARGSEV
jgi:hypothetical protein